MALMKLQATKPFRYGTRALVAGDVFEAKDREARVLLAIRKARLVREPADLPPPPPKVAEKIAAAVTPPPASTEQPPPPATVTPPDLAAARADYEAAIGKRPFHGWDVATLRAKIAEAQQSS